MTTKLQLFNDALRHLGERELASLSENREPRRVLDSAYVGAVKYCLEKGYWKHAQRTTKLDHSTSMTPTFGFAYAFEKPTDMVKPYKISTDERFDIPLLQYSEEGAFYLADDDPIYLAYISNDANYGADMSRWPETFSIFVGFELAVRTASRLAPAVSLVSLKEGRKEALDDALSKDASKGPTVFPPPGLWMNSRSRRGGSRYRDRGNRGSLIG